MADDNLGGHSYDRLMADDPAHIRITLDVQNPVEIGDFVDAFTSVASQYNKFVKSTHPELSADATLYVREVRKGSIEADLIPWAVAGAFATVHAMDQILIIEEFVKLYGTRLRGLFGNKAVPTDTNSSDLNDFLGSVEAIAHDTKGKATIEAAVFEDGKRKVRAAIKFTTPQARKAEGKIADYRRKLERKDSADHQRVLMIFTQTNTKVSPLGKRTGEWVTISDIADRDLPLIYASDLAEQRIKHEISDADDNVFKKGFVVDVNVERKGGRAVAYRVTNLHQVIDLPDED